MTEWFKSFQIYPKKITDENQNMQDNFFLKDCKKMGYLMAKKEAEKNENTRKGIKNL